MFLKVHPLLSALYAGPLADQDLLVKKIHRKRDGYVLPTFSMVSPWMNEEFAEHLDEEAAEARN